MYQIEIPSNMKSQRWIEFFEAIKDESILAKNEILKKKYFYDINQMEYDRIIELSSMLGVPFDVSLEESLDFIKKELMSAPFRVKWKSTVTLYKSFFGSIKRTGRIYLYYFTSEYLIRDSKNLLLNTFNMDPQKPYIHESNENFSGFISSNVKLDTGLKLDENWKLDESSSKKNTNHISMEIILDKVFFGDEAGLAPSEELAPALNLAPQTRIKYLMNPKYFSYINTNMEYSKRATEVVHIGCQLTAITDASHYYDYLGSETTMPDLLLNACTTDNFNSIALNDLSYIEFGNGAKTNLPSYVFGVGTQPTELASKLAKIQIKDEEKYENDDYFGVCAMYMGNLVNDRVIGTGDGIQTEFTNTLPFAPIKVGNVKITYTLSLLTYSVQDNGFGEFDSPYGKGTVNYDTGEIVFLTDIYYEGFNIIGTGNNSTKTFNFTVDNDKKPIKTNSIIIKYIQSGTMYVAEDDGVGNISGTNCSGTVNYTTGEVSVTFVQAPPTETDITMNFSYRKIMPPDNGTNVVAEYYFIKGNVDITEACVKDSNDNLIAYATFPRIRFDDFRNHLNMNFILKKTNF